MKQPLREITDYGLISFIKERLTKRAKNYYGIKIPLIKNRGKVLIDNSRYAELVNLYFRFRAMKNPKSHGKFDIEFSS